MDGRSLNAVVCIGCLLLHCPSPTAGTGPDRFVPSLRWEKLPPLPDREGFAGAFAGVSGGALIVAGGANITGDKWADPLQKKWYDTVYVLESPEAHWRTGFKLPYPLGYGVSVTTSDGVICCGGSDSNRHHAEVFQ
ncbi:MAG TPA: hypothetical protein P5022_07225, partial [Candidatus Paceibacterota bacterium]|nr:hypothetical protein [Candidatus Paceibacterota bacterium]